jgi:hypothetical protein
MSPTLSAGLGLMLATVGMDSASGIERYTFGQLSLWDGVGLVPVTLGLFAVPELVLLVRSGDGGSVLPETPIDGILAGVKDTLRHWLLVMRCSAIGSLIGAIPGMGASLWQWLAYAHAVRSSRDRSQFGKGAIEGILGPGAANNANIGGALLTTVAFGIPGSLSMAILLGAFTIQGVTPGPDMLLPSSQGGHLSLTLSFVWVIILSNLIAGGVCFVFLRQIVKINHVPGPVLVPFILFFVFLGAYSFKNSPAHLLTVLAFGAIGWVFLVLEWPRPPLLLGLVLGPILENRLFLSVGSYGLEWIYRPGVLVILALMLGAFLHDVLRRTKKSSAESADGRGANLVLAEIVVVAALMAMLGWAVVEARAWHFRSRLFPWVIGLSLLILCLRKLVASLSELKQQRPLLLIRPALDRPAIELLLWMLCFLLAIWFLGFAVALPLVIFVYYKWNLRQTFAKSVVRFRRQRIHLLCRIRAALEHTWLSGDLVQWALNSTSSTRGRDSTGISRPRTTPDTGRGRPQASIGGFSRGASVSQGSTCWT